MRTVALFALVALSSAALADDTIWIVDGDTLHVASNKYRMTGYDAPEIGRQKCQAESDLAVIAKNRLDELANSCGIEIVPQHTSCKWGRECAIVKIGGKDIAVRAIEEGWGQAWNGRGPKPDWCSKTIEYRPRPGC